ncbi:MAG: hypothetical protein PHH85_03505 [Candidatus Methanoperedens sp.]|nr:hypothetical protein [Candidatus Methanoperedens sp.]
MTKSKMSIQKKRKVTTPKKKVSMKFLKAKKTVSDYIKKNSHRQVWVSELAEMLELDLSTLVKVLDQLYDEGHIKKGTA